MKKLCFIVTALLLTVPALGVVNVSCSSVGDEVTVTYSAPDEANMPRAFGLDITLSAGNIVAITYDDPNFWVHPGNIVIVDGNVTDEGLPVGDPCDAPYPETQYGLGTGGMTIEMGSLYDPCDPCHPTGPPLSGVLLKFTVDASCVVTIAGNAARGNVVLESTAEASVNYGTCSAVTEECLKATAPEYADWVLYGKPECWCYQRQCNGDADGLPLGPPVWVSQADLVILRGAINQMDPLDPGEICADFDHLKLGPPVRVTQADLAILRVAINVMNGPPCCDNNQDCVLDGTDKYNFWTN